MTDTSREMGRSAEESFERTMFVHKIPFVKSDSHEDMHEHWDYKIKDEFRVEVKARKKLKRHNVSVNDDIVYVEFKNVQGHKGWIYGKADFIALERPDGFLVVTRGDLALLAETLVQNQWASKPTLYKKYKRRDRPDECVTVLSIGDVLSLPHKLFRYEL